MQKLTKYYFKSEHDIFYFKFEGSESVEYGLMTGDNPVSILELDSSTFQLLNDNIIATLTKTVYTMNIETNLLLPITIFEVHYYEELKLIVAEVKFETLQLSDEFSVPDWFGTEIYETHFDFELVFPKIAQAESFEQVASVIERESIAQEARRAAQQRDATIGTFEERLKKVKRRPTKI
jgi:hypothetical protein